MLVSLKQFAGLFGSCKCSKELHWNSICLAPVLHVDLIRVFFNSRFLLLRF